MDQADPLVPQFTLGPDAERLADRDISERLPPLLADMRAYIADELRQSGQFEQADCNRLSIRLTARLAWELGGARYYWPKLEKRPRI